MATLSVKRKLNSNDHLINPINQRKNTSTTDSTATTTTTTAADTAPADLLVLYNPHSCGNVYDYIRLHTIDEGTYGIVYKAKHKLTNKIYALKKIKSVATQSNTQGFSITGLREINILQWIRHNNIIHCYDIVQNINNNTVYIVMEYIEYNLQYILKHSIHKFTLSEIKYIVYHVLLGCEYLHQHSVIHRDFKPSNILIDSYGVVKICDFGMARRYSTVQHNSNTDGTANHTRINNNDYNTSMTPLVVTLWYRAPELILNSAGAYSSEIDIWSIGCILIELILGKSLFSGESEIDQLIQIFDILGTPTPQQWPEFQQIQLNNKFHFRYKPYKLLQYLPKQSHTNQCILTECGIELLLSMLHYNPAQRITASNALKHSWFNEAPKIQNSAMMPSFTRKTNK